MKLARLPLISALRLVLFGDAEAENSMPWYRELRRMGQKGLLQLSNR